MRAPAIVIFTSGNGGERYADTWPFSGRKTELLEGGLRPGDHFVAGPHCAGPRQRAGDREHGLAPNVAGGCRHGAGCSLSARWGEPAAASYGGCECRRAQAVLAL